MNLLYSIYIYVHSESIQLAISLIQVFFSPLFTNRLEEQSSRKRSGRY